MTKEDAIVKMQKGKKVTHPSFTDEEWMTMNNQGQIELEDGVVCEPYEFWRWRQDEAWDKDYSVFEE